MSKPIIKSPIDKNALYVATKKLAKHKDIRLFLLTIKPFSLCLLDGKNKFFITSQQTARVKISFIISVGTRFKRLAQNKAQKDDTTTTFHIQASIFCFLKSIAKRPISLHSTAALSRAIAFFISNQIMF